VHDLQREGTILFPWPGRGGGTETKNDHPAPEAGQLREVLEHRGGEGKGRGGEREKGLRKLASVEWLSFPLGGKKEEGTLVHLTMGRKT